MSCSRWAFLFRVTAPIATFVLLVAVATLPVHAQEIEKPCFGIYSDTDIPSGYGAPFTYGLGAPMLSMQAWCGEEGVRVELGVPNSEVYIYKYAYHRNGGDWERIELEGSEERGSWIVGSAEGVIENPHDDGKFVAYMCEKRDGSWKCGCRDEACAAPFWQLQTYQTQRTSLSSLDDMLEIETSDELYISQPSTYHALPGDEITIYGNAFSTKSAGNTLYFGDHAVEGVISETGSSVVVEMPDLPVGKYRVHLERDGERTEHGTVVWVKDDDAKVPTISSILPNEGRQGDVFTVYGSGFMAEGNDLVTSFGILENLPSPDGVSITFTYDPFEEEVDFKDENGNPFDYAQKVYVTAVTAGGVSKEPGTFVLIM